MIQPRPYTFKLCPNKEQLAALEKQASLLNILWNACLEQRESQWRLQCQRYGRNIKRNRRVIVEWENTRSEDAVQKILTQAQNSSIAA